MTQKKNGILSLRTGSIMAAIFGLFLASGFWVSRNILPTAMRDAVRTGRFIASIDPKVLIKAKQIEAAFKNGELPPEKVEPDFFAGVETLYQQQKLGEALTYLIEAARKRGALGDFASLKNEDIANQLTPMLESELFSRGMGGKPAYKFAAWETSSAAYEARLDSQGKTRGTGVTAAAFRKDLEALTGAKFIGDNSIRELNDPAESLKERLASIADARSSILIMSWAIYDDVTGNQLVDALLAKRAKEKDFDIKVMVDGQVSRKKSYNGIISRLEKSGIPTIRWTSTTNPYYGLHRKVMTVDGKIGYQGGRNFGDEYFHQGKAKPWRDTDMAFEGPAVREAERVFYSIWNAQVASQRKPDSWKGQPVAAAAKKGKAAVMYVNHEPNPRGDDPIYLATLKAVRAASKSIDIANAYFIAHYGLEKEILAARGRGVKVRIFTNSAQSVDEPIVTYPILSTLAPYLQAGCEVYLKQGKLETLHSKYMIVDGAFAWVGSYNLHPRSHQYEGEMALMTVDRDFAAALGADFQKDLDGARKAAAIQDLEIPASPAWLYVTRFFYNQI